MAGDDAIRKITEAIMLGQERPIWGQDYLGPETTGEEDIGAYRDMTPYQQGRSIPAELLQAMTGQQEEQYGGDQGLQDLAGVDPYGNPLPPTWAQPQMQPPSDPELGQIAPYTGGEPYAYVQPEQPDDPELGGNYRYVQPGDEGAYTYVPRGEGISYEETERRRKQAGGGNLRQPMPPNRSRVR